MTFDGLTIQSVAEVGDLIVTIWNDKGKLTLDYVSPALKRVLGYTDEQLKGEVSNWLCLLHPSDHEAMKLDSLTWFPTQVPQAYTRDYRLRTVDGTYRWLREQVTTSSNNDDGTTEYLCILFDISSLKKSEEGLSETKERLELVLEGTRLGMWDWNPQTNDVIFNERWAEMLGYRLEEIEQNLDTWSSKVHPDDLQACFDDIGRHVRGETTFYENIHRMLHKEGHWLYILDRGKIVKYDDHGKPIRFTGTHTDITAQKEAEIKAQKALQIKSQFLANMSHEIRTPLFGILGNLEVLSHSSLDAEQRNLVESIEQSGQNLMVILNDILDFSKLEAGELKIESVATDLSLIVQECRALFQALASKKGLAFTISLAPSMPHYLQLDPVRYKQVVFNLISNAIKFTESGDVNVLIRPVEGTGDHGSLIQEFETRVTDSGPGISAEHQRRIFERFNQADISTTRRFGGSGLGLSISERLATMMGGSIHLDSSVGSGSVFRLVLPLMVCPRPDLAPVQPSATPFPGLQSDLKILVADDNQVNRLLLLRQFQKLGFSIDLVEDGLQAVEQSQIKTYDIIFLDLHMPNLDGISAARQIRTLARGTQPVIIALTANILPETKIQCQQAQMNEYLSKPFKLAALRDLIERYSRRQARA